MGSLFWHRRDLRIDDNAGLAKALQSGEAIGAFVFDSGILNALPPDDRRVSFIWESVRELQAEYAARGGALFVLHGDPAEEIPKLAFSLGASRVFANRDYEPDAIRRDEAVASSLAAGGSELLLFKDHVIFEDREIRSAAGGGYSVFSPYKGAWLKAFSSSPPPIAPSLELMGQRLQKMETPGFPSIESLGFSRASSIPGGAAAAKARWSAFSPTIAQYGDLRDFPAAAGSSRLSADLRFGTVSPRSLAHWAFSLQGAGPAVWLSELIWRDFYSSILQRRPDLAQGRFFLPQFESISWINDPASLQAWESGQTGYPLVDAGMRELLATGFMHNRVRMVCASFLSKHLLCDWRLGEAHFARWLMDFDFASNNGGWQWAASTGSDPQPYFRIFNPIAQSERFDPQGVYIRRWVPELSSCPASAIHAPWLLPASEQARLGILIGTDYPAPIVDHPAARIRALAAYRKAAGK